MSKSGTLAYLAPEVYGGKGYSCGADWWSLGVVFYECIYSKVGPALVQPQIEDQFTVLTIDIATI